MNSPVIASIAFKIKPILKIYNVKRASIFGSFVRGEQKKESDIDILVEFKEPISMFSFLELKEQAEKKLKYPVDLVTYKSLHPVLKNSILKEKIDIYPS